MKVFKKMVSGIVLTGCLVLGMLISSTSVEKRPAIPSLQTASEADNPPTIPPISPHP